MDISIAIKFSKKTFKEDNLNRLKELFCNFHVTVKVEQPSHNKTLIKRSEMNNLKAIFNSILH